MPETYLKKCIGCGNDMVITSRQMHKQRCGSCAVLHRRESSLKRYYLYKDNPELRTSALYCEDCGVEIERNHRRKLCNACAVKRTRALSSAHRRKNGGQKDRAASEATPRTPPYICRRLTCVYYNRSIGCCDYRSIMGVGRGCGGENCDKYKHNDKQTDRQEESA